MLREGRPTPAHYNCRMYGAPLEWAVRCALGGLSTGTAPTPAGVMFLLRVYTDSGRSDVAVVLEDVLARGLELVQREPDPGERCEWLRLFDRASSISSDERLGDALRSSMTSAVDDLERLVGSKYEPGEGLEGEGLVEHLRRALALLAAFEITGRLPYSMLAEELVQAARQRWWNPDRGTFGDDFESNCRGAQLLCRLAALHEDPAYTDTVSVAHPSPYRTDAEQVVASLHSDYQKHQTAASLFGLALVDWLALANNLQ